MGGVKRQRGGERGVRGPSGKESGFAKGAETAGWEGKVKVCIKKRVSVPGKDERRKSDTVKSSKGFLLPQRG